MVLLHPRSCSEGTVAAIQLATGLRVDLRKRHARLVLPNGKDPVMAKPNLPHRCTLARDPHDGGHAA
jgi:hypothetical protein